MNMPDRNKKGHMNVYNDVTRAYVLLGYGAVFWYDVA